MDIPWAFPWGFPLASGPMEKQQAAIAHRSGRRLLLANERELLHRFAFVTPISLGPFVLRAETAAAAGQALLPAMGWADFRSVNLNVLSTRMSNPVDGDATPITSLRQLAEHIAEGCKPPDQFGIGTEHEKFGFRLNDLKTPPYEPSEGQPGSIRDLLHGLEAFDATPILDHGNTIGLKQGDASVSLEPAGQLELSGGIAKTLHETRAEFDTHFEQVRSTGLSQRPRPWPSRRWDFIRLRNERRCRGCPRAATPSCEGKPCRWLVPWGWT